MCTSARMSASFCNSLAGVILISAWRRAWAQRQKRSSRMPSIERPGGFSVQLILWENGPCGSDHFNWDPYRVY
jgi:hypothetical protein